MRKVTRVPIGMSVKVISYRSGGTATSGTVSKLRQLGWMWVTPMAFAHPSTEAGRFARRVVEPWNTMLSVTAPEGVVGIPVPPHDIDSRMKIAAPIHLRCGRGVVAMAL